MIDNLQGDEEKKKGEDDDDEMGNVLKQMKDLLQDCKDSLDNKEEVDQDKLKQMEAIRDKIAATDRLRESGRD